MKLICSLSPKLIESERNGKLKYLLVFWIKKNDIAKDQNNFNPFVNKRKTCKCSIKNKPTLVEVTLNELNNIAKDKPILSNEQLYTGWSLLAQDVKS